MLFFNVLVALVLLWFGSHILVKGAVSFSKKNGWSSSFVGLTILSLCSNLPEVAISITGAVNQLAGIESSDLVVGNILGSNISQITLILGIAGFLKDLKINKQDLVRSGLVLIVSSALLMLFSFDGFISPTEGFGLLMMYLVYFVLIRPRKNTSKISKKVYKIFHKKNAIDWVQILSGLIIVFLASDWAVKSSVSLAEIYNVSQSLLGIFLLGLGTSLPELFIVIQALQMKSSSLSVSTIIGSNIVGSLLAIGLSAAMSGWRVNRSVATFDMPFLVLTSVIVILFLMTKKKLDRKESLLLLCFYIIYSALKVMGY